MRNLIYGIFSDTISERYDFLTIKLVLSNENPVIRAIFICDFATVESFLTNQSAKQKFIAVSDLTTNNRYSYRHVQ